MATSIKITTPIPTADQLARKLGVSGERKKSIFRIAQEGIDTFYKVESKTDGTRSGIKKSKAA